MRLAAALWFWAGAALAQPVSAVLAPAQEVQIRPVITGQLEALLVAEGDQVSAGQVLARLDDSEQAQRVALARAVATAEGPTLRAEAQVAQADALLRRVQAARRRGAAQPWEVTQAEQALALAQADYRIAQDEAARLQAQLGLEQAVLARYALKAPFDGVIVSEEAQLGTSVDPRTVILTIAQLDQLEATAFVPVDWLPDLSVGQSLSARVEGARSADVSVTIKAIDPRMDPASRTVRTVFALGNDGLRYLAGATLTISAP